LNEKLDETKAALAPRSRFTFKTAQKNASAISLSDAAELAAQQRAKLPGYRPHAPSEESSIATTPVYLESPAAEPPSRPSEPQRANSLGAFLANAGVKSPGSADPQQEPRGAVTQYMALANSKSVNISSHNGLHILLPSSASHATSSGSVTNLRRCVVDMSIPTAEGEPFAGLAVKNIKQCLLICGTVGGAAHITGVEGSVIVVTTRQLRMHECKNCVVYLYANSRPIIEDCQGIQFAPLPAHYV
jgi:hypothetical protein